MSSNTLLDRSQIPIQETWHREDVFASTVDWNKEYDLLAPELKQLKSYLGKLASSSDQSS